MPAPSQLHLFPSTSTKPPMPRKSSLKKPKSADELRDRAGGVKGIAFRVSSPMGQNSSPENQQVDDQLDHSLFCSSSQAYMRAVDHAASVRSDSASAASATSGHASKTDNWSTTNSSQTNDDESQGDVLAPLPENRNFGKPPSSPKRHPASQLQRANIPAHVSTDVVSNAEAGASPNGDKPCPLPTRDQLMRSPVRSEYPPSLSVRSGSPTPVQSSSASTAKPPQSPPGYTSPMRSMFPVYDHSRPLHQQNYYPFEATQTPTLPREKVSNMSSSEVKQRPSFDRVDSAVAVVDGYEHIPIGDLDDLQEVWKASVGQFPVAGRKVQFGLLQPHGPGTSLAIGVSESQVLYSMSKETLSASDRASTATEVLAVKKHNPKAPSTTPVAQLALPRPSRSNEERERFAVGIFPQMAAVAAIDAVSNSPAASSIASFDPEASSPEARLLAEDAVAQAHLRYGCDLVRTARKRDSLGAITACYQLQHPSLGGFAVTVSKSTAGGRHARDPRAKISLHHPSATSAAVAAETLVLASLDFARQAFVLDTPGLLALEGPHVLDTVLCALVAVAIVENDALVAETVTFDPPPRSSTSSALAGKGKRKGKRASLVPASGDGGAAGVAAPRNWMGRRKKVKKEEADKLPLATEAALGLLGFGFKSTVWVLETGFKVTAGAILGVTHLARKA